MFYTGKGSRFQMKLDDEKENEMENDEEEPVHGVKKRGRRKCAQELNAPRRDRWAKEQRRGLQLFWPQCVAGK